ncbi:hypothetical protein QFZ87_000738 [Bacillus sp. SLBN-46]|uniref:hypothetical protein n=1 Tax=Bacillus sp. SLBN-46 TaxID=3042283 RepID=UPI002865FE3C|nr:hypothetical protein [Bacillus sp. SLBN-46]MDR6121141.1 hypothetical protein [Bacillus sp. SLBN-46]
MWLKVVDMYQKVVDKPQKVVDICTQPVDKVQEAVDKWFFIYKGNLKSTLVEHSSLENGLNFQIWSPIRNCEGSSAN